MAITNHQTTMALGVGDMREQWCFYVHELLPTPTAEKGEMFFAGICRLREVFLCPDAYRNTHWRATINDRTIIKTTVLNTADTERECYEKLSWFIRNVGWPTANKIGHQQSGIAAITCVEGPNAGKTWTTQERCALENGISQPALSNHLNGRKGYATVRGMKFRRGLA